MSFLHIAHIYQQKNNMLDIYMMCYFHRLLVFYWVEKMFEFGKKILLDYSSPLEEIGNQEKSRKNLRYMSFKNIPVKSLNSSSPFPE